MESLWNDLQALDRQLGGTGDFGAMEGSAYTHGSERYNSSAVSDQAFSRFCCALHTTELPRYRELILAAANLSDQDKSDTIRAAAERCGYKSWDDMTMACRKKQQRVLVDE